MIGIVANRILYITLIIIAACSCESKRNATSIEDRSLLMPVGTKKNLDASEYKLWMVENQKSLTRSKQLGDMIYQVFYLPTEFVILKENMSEGESDINVDSLLPIYSQYYYFKFRISNLAFKEELLKYNLLSYESYEDRVKYFSFQVSNELSLIEGNDTIPCAFSHFERVYGIDPGLTLNCGFLKNNSTKSHISDLVFLFRDKLFGSGNVSIALPSQIIHNCPVLM